MKDAKQTRQQLQDRIRQLEARIGELEAREQSLMFASQILATISEAIVLIDKATGTILEANPACARMFGYADGTLPGKPLTFLLEQDSLLADAIFADKWQGELLASQKNGTSFWCDVTVIAREHPVYGEVFVAIFHNIDDLISSMHHLQSSEKLYLSLVDTLPHYVYRIDREQKILFVNKAFQEILGLPFEQIVGRTFADIVPQDIGMLSQLTASAFEAGETSTQTIEFTNAMTQVTYYFHATKIPIFDDDGTIVAMQGIIENITQRIYAEKQLRASRSELQRLMQQLPIGIQVFDNDGLCTFVNASHEFIFGRSAEELVGQYNIFEDTLAKDMPTCHAARQALAGETTNLGDLEFEFSRADPRFASSKQGNRYLNVTIFPIFDHDSQVTGFVGMNVDVTERKLREQELQIREARYRAVVESQGEMISRYLPDGTLTFVNQAFCDFTGLDYHEAVGLRWQDIVPDEVRELAEPYIQMISLENPSTSYDEKKIDEDGNPRWIQWINKGIFNDAGELVEYQGIGIDITEKKLLEQERFEVELEKEQQKIFSEYIVRVSHEFRTPLSIINSSAYAMTRMADAGQREARYEKITKQVKQITKLVDSMTTMSKIDQRQETVTRNLADVNQLLEMAFTSLQTKIPDDGATLELVKASNPLPVQIVEKDFVKVVEMLGQNSIQHTGAGDTITLRCSRYATNAQIEIIDTGEGMDVEIIEHIFKRFYRADNTGKTTGLGLGLPISKAMVEQYGGTIDITSEQGAGTTVTIKFPLAET